jgi:type IV pilus assembly protein PilQ
MKWMTKGSTIFVLAITMLVGLICSLPGNSAAAQDSIKSSLGKLATIKSINVTGDGDNAELVIKLSAPATYTSYKTTAPLRLVVDVSQVTQGVVNAPLVFNKGNFKTVSATRFDTDAGVLTRIDIELNVDAEAVISASASKPGELKVSFPKQQTIGSSKQEKTSNIVVSSGAVPAADVSKSIPVPQDNPSSTPLENRQVHKLTSISVVNDQILLTISGGASEFSAFRLKKPERYVVDLADTVINLPSRIIPLNSAGVASARIGLYPDKVRVVLDSVNGTFPDAAVSKTDSGLQITLKNNPKTDTISTIEAKTEKKVLDVPQSPAASDKKSSLPNVLVNSDKDNKNSVSLTKSSKLVEPTKTSNLSTYNSADVEMIDFQVIEGISRVSIKVKGEVQVEQPVKSPGFVTLTVKNAGINKSLQRSLEARSFASPVLRVTPLLVKTKKGNDTKIRIAMRVAAPFEYRHEGDMLFIDFKNPIGLTADKVSVAIQDADHSRVSNPLKLQKNRESELDSELQPSESTVKIHDSSRSYKGRKVTLEFADAEVRKIFQLLSEVSNKNFVLGDDVTGTISIKLVNVPWDQALDIILETKGLDKREDNNIIIIKGKGKFKSQAEEEQELKKALTKSIELKAEMFSINYSDVGSIVTQLNNLKTDRGTIAQDARTNKIIVKDIPQVLDDMRKLISQLDIPEKQVMIEARIVEATSTFTRSLGVNWGLHYRDGTASFMGINQLDTSFGGVATTSPPTSGLSGGSGGAMGISFGTLSSNISLDLRLNAAASAGLIKIISTPKVATLNNKTAKIAQGQNVPYTSGTSTITETKFIEAALSLEVTPHINSNGTIVMKIDAKNDSVGQAVGSSTAPAINKKQATTEMLLRDGETTVIGGIFVDSDNDSDDGVPYLMDIPFLGKLFKSSTKTKTKTELLIFITPRILNSI